MKSFNIGDLTISVPLIQGGMGVGISLSGLASAVANMGGVGIISTVGLGLLHDGPGDYKKKCIDGLAHEIRKARQLTQGILGVNIMTAITNFSDMAETAIAEGVDIVFSGAGLPLDLPKYLTPGSKTKLAPIVSSARAAAVICEKWKLIYNYLPDAIVVEGPKAGGHLGFKADELKHDNNQLEQLVVEVLAVTQSVQEKYNHHIPVIAAGGIFSGQDMFQIMQLGVAGVQMGTRFVATVECDASETFKQAFLDASEEDIRVIKSPVGMPGRTIYNKFLTEAFEGKRKPSTCKYNCLKTCNPKTTPYCIAEALKEAQQGNLENGFAFTGANAGKITKISTVKEVFQDVLREYQEAEQERINQQKG